MDAQPRVRPEPAPPVRPEPVEGPAGLDGLRQAQPERGEVIHIHPAAPAQPALGAPCNGCGVCCLVEPCPLGQVLSRKRTGACEALRWHEAQAVYRCGAITDAAGVLGPRWRWLAPVLQRLAGRWIAAGVGCDAHLSSQRR